MNVNPVTTDFSRTEAESENRFRNIFTGASIIEFFGASNFFEAFLSIKKFIFVHPYTQNMQQQYILWGVTQNKTSHFYRVQLNP